MIKNRTSICARVTIILIIVAIPSILLSQYDNIWHFGDYAGLDFSNGSPTVINDGRTNTQEGVATMCDSKGELLLYTDGSTVWNRNHFTMANGWGLNSSFSTTQTLIVKQPCSDNIFYIFSLDAQGGSKGINYSVADLSNNSLGSVIQKNVKIWDRAQEKITAVKHENNKDIWIITHDHATITDPSDTFMVFLLTANGLNPDPVISTVGKRFRSQGMGTLTTSSDGNTIAMSNMFSGSGTLELFDFDRLTGKLSNPTIVSNNFITSQGEIGCYGITFSPDDKKLYAITNASTFYTPTPYLLFQFDISIRDSATIANSKVTLDTLTKPSAIQLAPDGKVYFTGSGLVNSDSLSVIHNPNASGFACNYQKNAIYLNGAKIRLGLPNITHWTFNQPDIDFTSNDVCIGDSVNFEFDLCSVEDFVVSLKWDFGDGSMDSIASPAHIYAYSGTYDVQLSVITNVNDTFSITKQVIIYDLPVSLLPDSITISENESAILNAGNASNSYQWFPSDFLDDASSNMPVTTPNSFIAYYVTITSSEGCSSIDSIFVTVVEEEDTPNTEITEEEVIFIPNAYNTSYGSYHTTINTDENLTFKVFDRNGKLIFTTNDKKEYWNANSGNREVNQGVYLYEIQLLESKRNIIGTITVFN